MRPRVFTFIPLDDERQGITRWRENSIWPKLEPMKNAVGYGILALGIVLLIFGFNESKSFSSDVSKFFTGNPTDHSMWLILGGAVAVVAGLILAVRSRTT